MGTVADEDIFCSQLDGNPLVRDLFDRGDITKNYVLPDSGFVSTSEFLLGGRSEEGTPATAALESSTPSAGCREFRRS